MQRSVKKVMVLAAGWFFIALGIVGLFLPILQGVLFLLIGLAILSTEYAWAQRWLQKLEAKFPGLSSRFHRVSHRIHDWFERHGFHSRHPETQNTPQGGDQ